MMMAMLVAGIACLLAGFLAIGFGIPVNEFSFGNTLILAGAMAACAGLIILSMWAAVRELTNLPERIGSAAQGGRGKVPQPPAGAALPWATEHDGPQLDDRPDEEWEEFPASAHPSAPPTVPWQEESAARDRPRNEIVPAPEPPPAKPRRNLMFSSTSRRQRERERAADSSVAEPHSAAARPAPESSNEPPAPFDDAWPKTERTKPAESPRRAARAPSTFSEPSGAHQPPTAGTEEQPSVTVIKAGVVDGMAYSLYSDGSIEAQMPEGMMRFASIDELRVHLDQRP
jgi:hypothetical protein